MTVTISPTELRRSLDELEAIEAQARAEAQRQAQADAQRRAEQAEAERERILNSIDLAPFDSAVWDALDNLAAASAVLIAASAQREQAKTNAVETITPFGEQSNRIRLGAVPTLDGYRLTSNRKEEVTEVCRIIGPVVRQIGGSLEGFTTNALDNRGHRGGNRLSPSQEQA